MAKSLRSKQKRKMRAVKRVRCAERELKKLHEMVKKTEEKEALSSGLEAKVKAQLGNSMETDSVPVKATKVVKSSVSAMETDDTSSTTRRSKRTMQDKNGQYPSWMNGRRLQKQKATVKRLKGKKNKKK